MPISLIGSAPLAAPVTPGAKPAAPAADGGFAKVVSNAVNEVNAMQGSADQLAQKLVTGDVQDIHQVMLALDRASNAFGLTVQVRNKALEAYQEIMRMQV